MATKAKKPVPVELDYTYSELVTAFLTLRAYEVMDLPVRTSLKVRRIHRDLEPEIKIRDEEQTKIFEDGKAEKDGDSWKTDENGDAVWSTKAAKTKGEKALGDLGEETCTVRILQLRLRDLEGPGLLIKPGLILALEDCQLLVDDEYEKEKAAAQKKKKARARASVDDE